MPEQSKKKTIAFWVLTGLIVLSQGASGVTDLLGVGPAVEGVVALGYPSYLLYILGVAKLAGVIVIASPGLLRLKEWAYAGLAIDFLGAAASHTLNGDGPDLILPSVVVLGILMAGYFLRPDDRRLPGPTI